MQAFKFQILLCVFSLTSGGSAFAECYHSPLTQARATRAASFVRSIAGQYKSRDCQMTIEVCEPSTTASGGVPGAVGVGATVGHILVIDDKGRESYLPLDFQEIAARHTRYEIQNGSRMFHYEYRDSNPDPVGGKRAVYYFEAVKTSDLAELKYIELGVLEYPHKRVQWTTCSFVDER